MMDANDLHRVMAMMELDSNEGKPKNTLTTRMQREQKIFRRTRSLNAPSQVQQFGPCGRIMKNSAMVMTIQDPASQRLTWYKAPLTVLVIKKVRDSSVLPPFVQLITWLIEEKRMAVYVETSVLEDPALTRDPRFQSVHDRLTTFKDGTELQDKIDFIVCLGGDGTLLYASLLFQQSVPPIMAFHLGSLGFLTPFEFDNFQEQVTNVLEGHAALTLRSRLCCTIKRKGEERQSGKPSTDHLVLNEVVVDRGPSPYLSNIDLFIDGKHVTSVQGDGLIVSTPTGSTAYAVAAGASMIHPSVPAIMITPICPHSLSFRPIVVPAGVELKISVPSDSRNTSWVSFDGRNRQELFHGDSPTEDLNVAFKSHLEASFEKEPEARDALLHIHTRVTKRLAPLTLSEAPRKRDFLSDRQITFRGKHLYRMTARNTSPMHFSTHSIQGHSTMMSRLIFRYTLQVTTSIYPVPSICAADQMTDWFDSLAECLHWNVRKRQKHLDELSDLTHSSSNDTLDSLDRDS